MQPVRYLLVPMLSDKLVLCFFQFPAENLDELAAIAAYQVVMVLMAVLMLIPLHAVAEINNATQPGLSQELERPRHRCIADVLVFLFDKLKQLLCAHMLFSTQKHIRHEISRLTLPQPPGP